MNNYLSFFVQLNGQKKNHPVIKVFLLAGTHYDDFISENDKFSHALALVIDIFSLVYFV